MAGPRGTNSPSEQHYNLTESPARTPIRARWWEVTAAQVALVPFYTPRTAEPLGHSNSAKQQRALTESPARIPILVRLSGMAAEGCATCRGQSWPAGLPIVVEFTAVTGATDGDDRIGAANGPEHSGAFEPGGDEGFATRFDHP